MTHNYDTFEDWYREANRICVATAGVGIDDLADGPSFDAFEAGDTPGTYVSDRLAYEGFPSLSRKAPAVQKYRPAAGKGAGFIAGRPITDRSVRHY